MPSKDTDSQLLSGNVISPTPVPTSPVAPVQDPTECIDDDDDDVAMFSSDDDNDPDPDSDSASIPDDIQIEGTPGKKSSTGSPLNAIAAAFRKQRRKLPTPPGAKLDPSNGAPPRRSTIPVLAGRKKSFKP